MTGDCETEARNNAYERYAFTESIKWKFFVNEWLTPSNKPCKNIKKSVILNSHDSNSQNNKSLSIKCRTLLMYVLLLSYLFNTVV